MAGLHERARNVRARNDRALGKLGDTLAADRHAQALELGDGALGHALAVELEP